MNLLESCNSESNISFQVLSLWGLLWFLGMSTYAAHADWTIFVKTNAENVPILVVPP